MRSWQVTPLEAALRVASALSVFAAALWVCGVNGFGLLALGSFPRWLEPYLMRGDLGSWTAYPVAPATFTDRADMSRLVDFYHQLNGDAYGSTPPHWGEILGGIHVQLNDPTLTQRVLFVALHVAICLAMAWIWWTLATVVAAGRSGTPFTEENARRLSAIGWVVLLGGTLATVAKWATLTWMVNTSSVADRMQAFSFGLADVPWWTIGVGASVLVLAAVWRRGVAMQHELAGLV